MDSQERLQRTPSQRLLGWAVVGLFLPDERSFIRWTHGHPAIGIGTAHGGKYALETSANLMRFEPLDSPSEGSNVVHEMELNPPPASRPLRWDIERS